MEGGWHEQTKMPLLEQTAQKLANAGMAAFAVIVGVDTSLKYHDPAQPPAFPRQIEEVEEAVKWVEENCGKYNGTTTGGVSIMGASAGAQIALYAGMRMAHATPGRIRNLVGVSGPYELPKLTQEGVEGFFNLGSVSLAANTTQKKLEELVHGTGPAEPQKAEIKSFLELWSVVHVMDKATAPRIMVFHGEKDTIVRPFQTEELSAHLTALSIPHTSYYVPVSGHGYTIGLSIPTGATQTVSQLYTAFLKE